MHTATFCLFVRTSGSIKVHYIGILARKKPYKVCVVLVLAARLAVCLLYLKMPLALSLLLFSVDVHT